MKAVEDFERQTASRNTDNKSNKLSKEGKYTKEKNAIRKILNFKRKKIKKQKPNKNYVLPNKVICFTKQNTDFFIRIINEAKMPNKTKTKQTFF